MASDKSVFRFYKDLLALRKNSKALIYGDFKELSTETDDFFAFTREYEDEKITVVCNFKNENTIDFGGELLLSNYADAKDSGNLYRKFEVRIFKM